jgi:hypothetical protein
MALPSELESIGKALLLEVIHTSNVSPRYIDVLPLELEAAQVSDTAESQAWLLRISVVHECATLEAKDTFDR